MNTLLTVDMITKEAIELFKNSNAFLLELENQYSLVNNVYVPSTPSIIGVKELVVLGSAAILTKNPDITRRFWSGWIK